MQERFDKGLERIKKQIKYLESGRPQQGSFFAPTRGPILDREKSKNKVERLGQCLASFVDYKKKIDELTVEYHYNKVFYDAHFEAFVKKLEKIGDLENDDDFKLSVPQAYHRTPTDISENTRSISLNMAFAAAMIGAIIGAIVLLSVTLTIPTLLPTLIFAYGAIVVYPLIFGPLLSGAALGAMVGAPIGAAVGYFDPFDKYASPSTNLEEIKLALAHLEEANTLLSEERLPVDEKTDLEGAFSL